MGALKPFKNKPPYQITSPSFHCNPLKRQYSNNLKGQMISPQNCLKGSKYVFQQEENLFRRNFWVSPQCYKGKVVLRPNFSMNTVSLEQLVQKGEKKQNLQRLSALENAASQKLSQVLTCSVVQDV